MSFKKTLMGMVVGAGMFLGSASPVYSQTSKYSQPEIEAYRNYNPSSTNMGGDLLAYTAFAIWLTRDRIKVMKKMEGRK